MSSSVIFSISGGHPECSALSNTVRDLFNMYSTANAVVVHYQNPYALDSDIEKMEKNGHFMAAAIRKIELLYKQNLHMAMPDASVIVVDNYLDDIILNFITKEAISKIRNGENDTSTLQARASTLISLALNEYKLELPAMEIPFNDTNDPQKVIFTPFALEMFKKCMSQFSIFEYSDYLFPENSIQTTAYFTYGLYNRYCNVFTNKASNEVFYLVNGGEIPKNYFGLTIQKAMEGFEAAIVGTVKPMNYTGRAVFDPFYREENATQNPEEAKESAPVSSASIPEDSHVKEVSSDSMEEIPDNEEISDIPDLTESSVDDVPYFGEEDGEISDIPNISSTEVGENKDE